MHVKYLMGIFMVNWGILSPAWALVSPFINEGVDLGNCSGPSLSEISCVSESGSTPLPPPHANVEGCYCSALPPTMHLGLVDVMALC